MKSAKDYLNEANSVVSRIPAQQGIELHKAGGTIFVDVRDSAAIAESGTIAGFIEFAADPDSPFYNPELDKHSEFVLVCGAGGQAALAGKTLIDMGYEKVRNVGGFPDWRDAGGATETA